MNSMLSLIKLQKNNKEKLIKNWKLYLFLFFDLSIN